MRPYRPLLVALALAGALAGCSGVPLRRLASVTPLPPATPMRDQSTAEQKWDDWECREQVRDKTGYNTYDSPMANFFQKVFFWGTAGASVGGLVTGLPTSVSSEATEGLIAGAGAGGIVGTAHTWKGRTEFERVWATCMEAQGYTIAGPGRASPPSRPTPDNASAASGVKATQPSTHQEKQ